MTTCCVDSNLSNSLEAVHATPAWLSKLAPNWRQWWLKSRKRQADRRAITQMQKLDDATLRDIGLHRGDISWASHLPRSADVTAELELLARGHRMRRDL